MIKLKWNTDKNTNDKISFLFQQDDIVMLSPCGCKGFHPNMSGTELGNPGGGNKQLVKNQAPCRLFIQQL